MAKPNLHQLVLQSLVGSKAYYAFGFLTLTTAVVSLTTATVTVLMCYFHLCAEEYRCVASPLLRSCTFARCGMG